MENPLLEVDTLPTWLYIDVTLKEKIWKIDDTWSSLVALKVALCQKQPWWTYIASTYKASNNVAT